MSNRWSRMGVLFCAMGLLVACDKRGSSQVSSPAALSHKVYDDPKGNFRIRPPDGWEIQEYPEDPRGKVAFTGPEGAQLRVLTGAKDFTSFEGLTDDVKAGFAKLDPKFNTREVRFCGLRALESTAAWQGRQMLFRDVMIGNVRHNLMFSATSKQFNEYRALGDRSMNTYEPKLDAGASDEVKRHALAGKLRLAQLMLADGEKELARQYMREGLDIDPTNTELLRLSSESIPSTQK